METQGPAIGRGRIDPAVAAAFALRATPGGYAVLLGSGVSRAAGVPTGHEVLIDLCRRLAVAMGATDEAAFDPIAWYASRTGGPASYDNVLASLTSQPEERVGLLRGYFEPTEEERDQNLKVPTAAHQAVAALVQAGLVKVILTTNFDRLIERALDEAGIPYVVTATPAAIAGALPLHLYRCLVVKLHGDYLDPAFLNTPEELAAYDPAVDRLLDRVFDDHGLIAAGWSATYDPALRAAVERATTRRFSSWWVDPASLSEHAQRLVTLRQATVVSSTADAFLRSVAEATAALAEIDQPAPQTVTLASATAKRALGAGGDRIRLHDLIKEEIARVAATPEVARELFQGATLATYGRDVAAVEAAAEILLAVVAIAAYWGDSQTDSWWLPAISDFVERVGRRPAGGQTVTIALTRYPGLLLFQTGAVASTAAGRWDVLAKLDALQPDSGSSGRRWPAAISLDPGKILGGFSNSSGQPTGLRANDRPVDQLRDVVRSTLTQHLLLTDADFNRAYETTEYLLAVSSFDWKEQLIENSAPGTAPTYAPIRFAGYWLQRTDEWGQEGPRIALQARNLASSEAAGPVQAGMFRGDPARFTAAADEFETEFREFARKVSWR